MRRCTTAFGTMLLALMLAFSAAAGAAEKKAPPSPKISAQTLIKAARAALAEDKLDDAELLLKGVRPG